MKVIKIWGFNDGNLFGAGDVGIFALPLRSGQSRTEDGLMNF